MSAIRGKPPIAEKAVVKNAVFFKNPLRSREVLSELIDLLIIWLSMNLLLISQLNRFTLKVHTMLHLYIFYPIFLLRKKTA